MGWGSHSRKYDPLDKMVPDHLELKGENQQFEFDLEENLETNATASK